MTKQAVICATLMSVFSSGCAHSWTQQSRRPTCVVLSAGGPAGVAHLGALEAIAAENLRVDCVTGTSMGALIGSLYAAAPQVPVREQYEQLISQYKSETQKQTGRNALVGSVLGAVIAGIITGGATTLPFLLGAASAGAAAGAQATPKMDLDRFAAVLDRFHGGATIEALAVPYATFYHERHNNGLHLLVARRGLLAAAVARSLANPFIFEGFDPVEAGYVDAGFDRLAAVPVEDTCKLFPKARILAINATGQPVVHSGRMRCPMLEVKIPAASVGTEALAADSPEFLSVVTLGFETTRHVLREDAAR